MTADSYSPSWDVTYAVAEGAAAFAFAPVNGCAPWLC